MVAWTSQVAVGGAVKGPVTLGGGGSISGYGEHLVAWQPTARRLESDDPSGEVDRESTTVFYRGLAETIRVTTNTAAPWTWRRICFTMKGLDIILRRGTTDSVNLYNLSSEGYSRLLRVLTNDAGGVGSAITAQILQNVFQGSYGADYNDLVTAKTHNQRVTIMYDKTQMIRSGNSVGVDKVYKMWHPMNKNLVYGDNEVGGSEQAEFISTYGKAGMGDYYVIDIIRPHSSATTGDTITFNPHATLYWHEK